MKTTVGLLCGGQSEEHEISLISANNILKALDRSKYNVQLFAISKSGEWFYCEDHSWLPTKAGQFDSPVENHGKPVTLVPGKGSEKIVLKGEGTAISVDTIFPILHGPFGEDGTVQGVLKLLNIPFVGSDVTGSAIGMDKKIMKQLLLQANIPTARYKSFKSNQKEEIDFQTIQKEIGTPVFIKPSCLGSSIGISRATTEEELKKGVKEAFQHDNTILIEEEIQGREIECAILGNEKPKASPIGEIITPKNRFYSYEAKYIDENTAQLSIPAKLDTETAEKAQKLAIKVYNVMDCKGLARVDMFLQDSGKLYLNEINTLPGFTNISMYPSLWQEAGISYTELISQLIQLSMEEKKIA